MKVGGLSQRDIILRYLSWVNGWVFGYNLNFLKTQWGLIGSQGEKRCRELRAKGLIESRMEGKFVQYRYCKEPQSNLSDKSSLNTQTTMNEEKTSPATDNCQPVDIEKMTVDQQFEYLTKNLKFQFGNERHYEANRLLNKLTNLKKPNEIQKIKKEIIWLLK